MKKTIISILLLFSIAAGAFAQGYDVVEAGEEENFNHNEVYLAAGMPSFLGLFSGMFVAIFKGLAEAGNQGSGNGSSSGSGSGEPKKSDEMAFSIAGGYNYFFNEHFGLGAFASYERFMDLNIMTVQAKVTGQYGWEHFKIYHTISGGIIVIPGTQSQVSPVFDITYLGLKLDFEDWNVFVDASIPTTGIIKVGASYKF